jgi:hypothetical protein
MKAAVLLVASVTVGGVKIVSPPSPRIERLGDAPSLIGSDFLTV